MSRLIDADKLDDVVTELIEKGWMITRNDYKRIDSVISEFPTVSQWIPCSERLPETYGHCLVTVYDGHTSRVSYIRFSKREQAWVLTGRQAYWKVIAWMPLPEPYKEVDNEQY